MALLHSEKGQSLIELLLGVAIGAVLVGGAAVALVFVLTASSSGRAGQTALYLSTELMQSVRAYAGADWHNVEFLARLPVAYYLAPSGASFATSSGAEEIAVGGGTYLRSFSLTDVYRGGTLDPGTLEVVVTTAWTAGGKTGTTTFTSLLARRRSEVMTQTDWSGGPVQPAQVVSAYPAVFASSTQIDYAGTPGAAKVLGF